MAIAGGGGERSLPIGGPAEEFCDIPAARHVPLVPAAESALPLPVVAVMSLSPHAQLSSDWATQLSVTKDQEPQSRAGLFHILKLFIWKYSFF